MSNDTDKHNDLAWTAASALIMLASGVVAEKIVAVGWQTMTGRPVFDGKASVVGTVYDVADTVEEWICLGAVDGIVFLPASLPTDLASVIRGIMPLLYARGIDTVCPCGHRDLLP